MGTNSVPVDSLQSPYHRPLAGYAKCSRFGTRNRRDLLILSSFAITHNFFFGGVVWYYSVRPLLDWIEVEVDRKHYFAFTIRRETRI